MRGQGSVLGTSEQIFRCVFVVDKGKDAAERGLTSMGWPAGSHYHPGVVTERR